MTGLAEIGVDRHIGAERPGDLPGQETIGPAPVISSLVAAGQPGLAGRSDTDGERFGHRLLLDRQAHRRGVSEGGVDADGQADRAVN